MPGCEMKKAYLLLQCALPILAGCAANSTPAPAPTPVSVLVTPSSATVAPGTSAQLTASVTGDSAGKGVNWTVTCSTQQCGSVSPASTPSGVPTTYTAPSPPSTSLTVTITAASVADGSKAASAIITVPAIQVAINPASVSVATLGTQQFTATVMNDPNNKGVSWSLTQGGANCSPGCGTIAPATTPSGNAATYTAPSTVPRNPNVTVVTTSMANTAVSATATITVTTGVGVSVSPGAANVSVNATQQFTATVTNDPSNKGVNWTLSQSGTPCSPGCGTISPASTASGAATTYTAPSAVPIPAQVTVSAISVADITKSATATVTVLPPIAVSISPTTANVSVNAMQQFTATVTNDPNNKGVSWTLTQSGTPCSPGCGTISPVNTASGAATTYTAPSVVPANPNVTIVATSVANTAVSATAAVTVTPGVGVSVSPATANVNANATQQFTATVTNDPSSRGVSWTLTQGGAVCSPGCGTIAPPTTASGSPASYTAPSTIPANPNVTVVATSVADTTKSATATVTVTAAVGVSVSPATASVGVTGTQQFTATVTNDPSNKGVSWTLMQSATPCSPGCGTISPVNTGSGVATTYTAPSAVPTPAQVTVTATSVADTTKFAAATVTVAPPIGVTVSPSSASVSVNATQQFTATVTNDPSNKGVNWTLMQSGIPCSPGCGTITPASTASGAATTYTAPSAVPSPAQITINAISVADTTKSATATVTVMPPIAVSVSPTTANVTVNTTQQFTAAVTNDPSNKGVNWTLTQGGTPCSPSCGTIAPATTSSGSAATYTAPGTVPANPNVSVVATSAADATKSATATATVTPPIAVSVSPTTANVDVTKTQQFTATVTNDPSNKGVNWTLTQSGTPCSPGCGTISPVNTASGAGTTYTAPSAVPSPAQVTVTAISAADTTKSALATVTVTVPIAVSVSPATANVTANTTQQFTATVTNDPSNKGVSWMLTQGGAVCSPNCGTIAPATTASGSPASYTAPATAPANPNVTVVATSVANTTVSATAAVAVTPAIAVSVLPTSASVNVNKTQQFTATVTNDAGNKGVNWTLTQSGTPCSPGCGTMSPASTASGVAMTYTAPSAVPSPAQVTVTAISAADTTKFAAATVTVTPPIAVSVLPATANVPVTGTQQFTATVTNEAGNKGVSWTLTQSGTVCSPGCGTIAPATTPSGTAATYTAPGSVPVNADVTIVATSVADTTASATATAAIKGVTVSVAPTTTSVNVNKTQPFTATVTNDSSNKGVSWTLTQSGTACSPSCGTINPANTASGVSTTYTAPASVPTPAQVTLTATSVADSTKSAAATVTVTPPISVSVSPTTANVLLGTTQQFTATVSNDASNSGVSWSLMQNGSNCSPTCGTLSSASTSSGTAVTYTAPASMPAPAGVTIVATAVADTTESISALIAVTGPCGTGNEALLKGQYAFLLRGFDANGPVGIAGSFDADGAGNIAKTVGLEDINRSSGPQTNLTILSAGSSYSVGSDNRGCMTLVNSTGTTTTLRFALGSIAGTPGIANKGWIEEFDDATGTGTRAAVGEIRLQDPASFSNTQFSGPYAFGFYGQDGGGVRFAVAGTFTPDGLRAITAGAFDSDAGGTLSANTPIAGASYSVGPNGRGTMSVGITVGGTNHLAMYMINSSDAFFVTTDSLALAPIFSGEAQRSATAFTTLSLNGTAVFHLSGDSSNMGHDAVLALASADGTGNLTSFHIFQNIEGIFTTQTVTTGTYSVAPNGRVTLSGVGLNPPPVLYLSAQNQGFVVGTGPFSEIGKFEQQTGGPFSNASFSGAYFFGTETPLSPFGLVETGTLTADSSTATTAVTSDQANDGNGVLVPNSTFNYTFAFAPDGTGNIGGGTTTTILISPSRLVYMQNTQLPPIIFVIEK